MIEMCNVNKHALKIDACPTMYLTKHACDNEAFKENKALSRVLVTSTE